METEPPRRALVDVFGVLVRLFFSRFFDKSALSPQGEPVANVAQILGILAAPGAFVALLFIFLPLSTSGWDLIAVRCLFLSFSMAVMGFIVVFEWDALFPDYRDYQILLPLPLPLWIIFLSKVTALSMFLVLFLADINFFATSFWPSIDEGNVFGVIGTHLLVVGAAGLFSAFAAAAIHGLLITLIPQSIFRPTASYAQTVLMSALVMLLVLAPLLAGALHPLIAVNSHAPRYIPAFWFSGLYEELRPAAGNRALAHLGQMAMPALGCTLAAFVVTHLPGYRRHARKLLETAAANPAGPARLRVAMSAAVDRILLRNPVQQAVYHFIGQTISRSMKHRLFLAVYAGFGAALVVIALDQSGGDGLAGLVIFHRGFVPDHEGLLRIPLTLSFVLISGLRAAFNFPAELSANWTFRVIDTNDTRECLIAMRKWIFSCGVFPLFLLLTPLELAFFPWPVVLFQLAYSLILSALLVEAMFFDFRKIPFTCSWFPGKINLVTLIVIYVTGFTLCSSEMANLESWLMITPLAAAVFYCAAICAWITLWKSCRRIEDGTGLDYLDDGDPEVRTLGLTPH